MPSLRPGGCELSGCHPPQLSNLQGQPGRRSAHTGEAAAAAGPQEHSPQSIHTLPTLNAPTGQQKPTGTASSSLSVSASQNGSVEMEDRNVTFAMEILYTYLFGLSSFIFWDCLH